MREIDVRAHLERIGHSVLSGIEDIHRVHCPRCHLSNIDMTIAENGRSLIIECTTPQVFSEEHREYDSCDFYVVVTGIPTISLPDPTRVAEPEQAVTKPQPRKPVRKRRR